VNFKGATSLALASLLSAFGLVACTSTGERTQSQPPPNWRQTADGVIVSPSAGTAKQVRLEVFDDRIIRVTAIPGESLDLPKSLMVTALPDPNAKFEASQAGDELVLRTADIVAKISLHTGQVRFGSVRGENMLEEYGTSEFKPVTVEGKPFYAIREQFNRATTEGFYGLGQHQNRQYNLNGEDVDIAQHNMDIGIPFIVSSRNYGVLWDNNAITRLGDPHAYQPLSAELNVTDANGNPGGLTARYSVNGAEKVVRREGDVNYQYIRDLSNWPKGLNDLGGNAPKMVPGQTVTWKGRIESDKTGTHKFRLYVSSYVKLYVDGKLLIDAWRQNWNPWYRNFELPMTAGVPRTLRIEWQPNDGYIRLLHADPLPSDERHELSLSSEVANAVDYYFIAGKDYDDVIRGYRELTGKAVMLPRWAYGFWQSRDHYTTQKELADTVRAYRKQHLPLDVIVQDWRYWPDPEWGSHHFDPARYPDPAGMVKDVHDLHAHIMISVWPKFYPSTENYKELDAVGGVYHGNIDLGVKDWVDPGYLSTYYDPYNHAASDIYWRQIEDKLGVLGIDAWWLDNDEPDIHSNVDIDERQKIMGPTALGPGAEYFNSFPLLHVGGVYDHWRALHPDARALILTRSGFGGIQRYASTLWSGDLTARWSDLADQIPAGLGLSMAGVPDWTVDIGGYVVEDKFVDAKPADLAEWRELYARWFETGAFLPVFRSHGQGRLREIYNIAPPGTAVYNALASYDRLRYRLLPYTYTLAGEVYQNDYTMMRGLVMDFASDPRVAEISDEYMFGPAILVAPVTAYRARERDVYLPAGTEWYDFWTGERSEGGKAVRTEAPLERIPLYIRAGSILPMGPKVEYADEMPDGTITLLVYTGASGHFDLYEDDGLSNAYEKGAYARIPISYDDASGVLTIGARQGAFGGGPRQFRVRFVTGRRDGASDPDAKADATVDYAGSTLSVHR
jgi:alpha-D-xyloside xylohydrolase